MLDCNITGYLFVGALVGVNTGEDIIHCGVSASIIHGSGDTNNSVGGLVGVNSGLVESCVVFNSMIIDTHAQYGVGGLVGYNWGGILTNSCIYLSSYTTSVTGVYGVGGLVGMLYNSEKGLGHVINCYSSATVMGRFYVGGLIGYHGEGAVTLSYWDTTVSGIVLSDGGTGKTTVQMRQQATYEGWDFVNIWVSYEGIHHPILKWVVDLSGEGSAEGEVPITVPNVTGMTEQQARNALESAGLNRIQVVYNCSNTVAQGNVLSQAPSVGEEIFPRVYVQLFISNGLCPGVIVPDVVEEPNSKQKM